MPIVRDPEDACSECGRKAQFSIGKPNDKGGVEWIRVCGYHDRLIGVRNLQAAFHLTFRQAQEMDRQLDLQAATT